MLFFRNHRRHLLYLIGVPYTAVQIPIWLVAKSEYGVVDYVDEAVQIVLIVVLVYLYPNTSTEPAKPAATPAD
ncbi:hypothetical protein [Natrinema hispanicum]|uniref:Uncharacterized protein n=1 Tax=Natrinema hispanicum TaxID=392421 RepID=A0A1G6RW70_9EURY|nr:hypothetical protein [Natrinema hispanicum]SDD08839.1 hypothetical protein SAMN05192552_101254 [Natrinema hispanicum]SET77325.1 hypothetical protein SAMN04488694_11257 [Natrinema hispanicum]